MHWIVLQQLGHQVFSSSANDSLWRVTVLHLCKDTEKQNISVLQLFRSPEQKLLVLQHDTSNTARLYSIINTLLKNSWKIWELNNYVHFHSKFVPLKSCGMFHRGFSLQMEAFQQETRSRGPPDSTGPPSRHEFCPRSSLEEGSRVSRTEWTSCTGNKTSNVQSLCFSSVKLMQNTPTQKKKRPN